MKRTKAQLTVFMILALVILVIAGIAFYVMFSGRSSADQEISMLQDLPLDAAAVKSYVKSCVDKVSVPGIYLLASKGGYIYSYDNVFDTENAQIAYHLIYGSRTYPENEFMEEELSRFIEDSLSLCLDPKSFPDYEFEFGKPDVNAVIGINDVSVEVDYPIIIKKEGSKTTIPRSKVAYPIRLGHILKIRDDLLSKIKDSSMIDLDYLASMDVKVTFLPYDGQNMIYSIYDEKSNIDSASFLFNFAIKTSGNSAPSLEFIPDFVLTKGKLFSYIAEASDPDNGNLYFYSDNSLIDIGLTTGVISFFPESTGEYTANICVRDPELAEDCTNVKFMVEDG